MIGWAWHIRSTLSYKVDSEEIAYYVGRYLFRHRKEQETQIREEQEELGSSRCSLYRGKRTDQVSSYTSCRNMWRGYCNGGYSG